MRYLSWFLRIVLFLLLFGFAVKNTETVTLRYYFGLEWQAPLVLVALVFFGVGAAIGIMACLVSGLKKRRRAAAQKDAPTER